MEFPLGKPVIRDPEQPCNLIVQASLGIEHDSVPFKGSRRSFLHPSKVFDYELDVQFIVLRGTGTLDYFDHDGRYVNSRVLEPGTTCDLQAGEKYRYAPTHGLLTIFESDNGESDEDIQDL